MPIGATPEYLAGYYMVSICYGPYGLFVQHLGVNCLVKSVLGAYAASRC